MKAVRLYEYGPATNLKYETDAPDPEVGEDDVLVGAAATSVNPIDWKMRSGAAKERFPVSFPAILGRDVSGLVRAVGSNVRGVKVGERVMALTNGTYAELVIVKGNEITHIPDGVDIIEAAALPLVVLTGDQLVREACGLQKGQSILVTGALGSVGRAAVHTAKKLGAHVIAGVRKHQLDEAKELGAHALIALDDEDAVQSMGKVDAIADTVGGDVTTPLLRHIKEGGICGTVVTPPPDAALHPDVKVVPHRAHPDPSKVREFADDYRDGKFKLPIVRKSALSEAAEAQEFAEKGGSGGKVLLLML
ncbi:Zn-dependent oxidoreductase, NADPH:quinone reductase [Terriglobus roseus DSM 18391]|uniref:Zn-dependent oxidoreductase, NADPH:quinone reductase n=1 Tax=Terriglobus roseus (strain DSM 18391 / NRRL B-41598 / KBS 63) TaxID=926566 RepID=I3ZMW3_TERRK|nr:NADP-dependent oxidoreductase [Terriglobus roseus]AFL90581.1 Zn-dependent oxidoreductase, NADPH:quinone reductase [Terriglobus roseus DSM 18391]